MVEIVLLRNIFTCRNIWWLEVSNEESGDQEPYSSRAPLISTGYLLRCERCEHKHCHGGIARQHEFVVFLWTHSPICGATDVNNCCYCAAWGSNSKNISSASQKRQRRIIRGFSPGFGCIGGSFPLRRQTKHDIRLHTVDLPETLHDGVMVERLMIIWLSRFPCDKWWDVRSQFILLFDTDEYEPDDGGRSGLHLLTLSFHNRSDWTSVAPWVSWWRSP